jgi:hypothetical protein
MANNFLKSLIKTNKRGNITKGDYQTGLFGGGKSPAAQASAQASAQRTAQRASEQAQQRADAQANQRAAQARAAQARATQQNTSASNSGLKMQQPSRPYPQPISTETSTPSPYNPIKVRKPKPRPRPLLSNPLKPTPAPDLPDKPQPSNFRTTNVTPNYMTQYNNSINPKANTKVAYAAEPMQSRINNQYYATRNNGAFNENGFQQFMQQAQQQQPPPQYAQPQPVTDPNVIAQPLPVEEPTMFPQPQPVEDNTISSTMFGGTAKRMSSVKKSSKKPKIMKTYEYSPQRMHEGTGKPPKLPSTNRTIYSTKKFY